MRSLIVVALAALVAGLAGAQTAGATAHYYTASPSSSFVGSQVTTHTWTFQTLAPITTYNFACANVTYDGLTPSGSGTSTTFPFNFHPSNCTLNMGSTSVPVTPPWCSNAWRIGLNNNLSAGSTVGTWTSCQNLTFQIPSFGCSVTYAYTTIANSVTLVDRDSADTLNTLYTAAGGMRAFWTNVALPYTSNCYAFQPSGTGAFNGVGFFRNVWVGP